MLSGGTYIDVALLSALYFTVVATLVIALEWHIEQLDPASVLLMAIPILLVSAVVAMIGIIPIISSAATIARKLPRTRDQIALAAGHGALVYLIGSYVLLHGIDLWLLLGSAVCAAAGRASVNRGG